MTSSVIIDLIGAALLMHAKGAGEKGVLRVDSEELLTIALDNCGDWVLDQDVNEALSTLAKIGLARSTRDAFSGGFHKIDANALSQLIKSANQEMRKFEKECKDGDLSVLEKGRFPALDALTDHPVFERYHDFGDEWLRRALHKLKAVRVPADPPLLDDEPQVIDPQLQNEESIQPRKDFILTEEKRIRLVDALTETEQKLEHLNLGNAQKAQLRAYIISARILAESPDPPADLIWEIIGRANSIAGIASLFVSILALFT